MTFTVADHLGTGTNGYEAGGRRLCALVIEPDPDYAIAIRALLDAANLDCLQADALDPGLELLENHHVHLVVYGANGDTAARRPRSASTTCRRRASSCSCSTSTRRRARTRPAPTRSCPSRSCRATCPGAVRAALRTRDPDSILQMATSIRVGDVLFDAERREVRWDDGFRVRFSAREWELLAVLLGHANRYFTAEELRDAAWRDASLGTDQVRGYVYRLRRKLEGRHAALPPRHQPRPRLLPAPRSGAAPRGGVGPPHPRAGLTAPRRRGTPYTGVRC